MKIEKNTDFIFQRCENSCLFYLIDIATYFIGIARHVPHAELNFFRLPLTKQKISSAATFSIINRDKEIKV